MKRMFAFLVICSLGLCTIGCGEPAKPAKKADENKVEDKMDGPAKTEEPAKP